MRRWLKRVLRLGVVAGVGYAVWRFFEKQRSGSGVEWEPQPFPYPPQPRQEDTEAAAPATAPAAPSALDAPAVPEAAPEPAKAEAAWVEPTGDTCPASHPVKGKLSSKIFHVPGGQSYDRTHPDRCYRDSAAAEADGLRQAAR